MDFKKDERYYNINTLNVWFALSSIVFLFAMVWLFIDDFYKKVPIKEQINHRELATEITNIQISKVEDQLDAYNQIAKCKLMANKFGHDIMNVYLDNVQFHHPQCKNYSCRYLSMS